MKMKSNLLFKIVCCYLTLKVRIINNLIPCDIPVVYDAVLFPADPGVVVPEEKLDFRTSKIVV